MRGDLERATTGTSSGDLDTTAPDYPALLACVEENQTLLLFTNKARAYRYPVRNIDSLPVRAHGVQPFDRLGMEPDEQIVAVLPEQASGYVALVSQIGKVRSLRHHLFGEHMRQGNPLFNVNDFGSLAAACWSPGSIPPKCMRRCSPIRTSPTSAHAAPT